MSSNRLGDALLKSGKVSQEQLREGLALQKEKGGRIGSALVKIGALTEKELVEFLSKHFGVPAMAGRYGTGANMRLFELAALGRPQLVDAKADVARHLRPNEEVVLYRSLTELSELAAGLLADPARRESLGRAARRRAAAEHTWDHRMAELLSVALA